MNKKKFPVSINKLRAIYNKRMMIACIPSAVFIITALLLTAIFVIPSASPQVFITRLILTVLSIALAVAFIICSVGGIVSSIHLKMHNLHTFIQINEKSFIVSEFVRYSFAKKTAMKRLFICDIRDIDDFLIKNGKIIVKLKAFTAKRFTADANSLAIYEDENEDTLTLLNESSDGESVKKIAVIDAFILPLRIAQRVFLVAGNVREREARRVRFRNDMLERAAKAPRYKTLRDRFRPEIKNTRRY